MQAKSIKGKSPEDIQLALLQSMAEGFMPTVAFVFLTRLEHLDEVTSLLDSHHISIFGASTSQKFSEEGIEAEGMVVLLMDLNPAYFHIVLQDFNAVASVYEAASLVGAAGRERFDHPAFIISTADINTPFEEVIHGILNKAGIDSTIVGGVAGEPIHFTGAIFTNHSKSNSGLIAMILNEDKIDVKGIAVSGWKPVGTKKMITQCTGNWVNTIDHEPALEVIKKFLGTEILTGNDSHVLGSYPLQVEREFGKPIMNPVILWNEDNKSVMLGTPVKEGTMFRFSLPPDLEVIDSVINSTKIIKAKDLPETDALLIFSCVGRLSSLGPLITSEIEGLAATWNKPMAGFFSLGEFGKLDYTRPEFHGTTVSWVALKEK